MFFHLAFRKTCCATQRGTHVFHVHLQMFSCVRGHRNRDFLPLCQNKLDNVTLSVKPIYQGSYKPLKIIEKQDINWTSSFKGETSSQYLAGANCPLCTAQFPRRQKTAFQRSSVGFEKTKGKWHVFFGDFHEWPRVTLKRYFSRFRFFFSKVRKAFTGLWSNTKLRTAHSFRAHPIVKHRSSASALPSVFTIKTRDHQQNLSVSNK